MGISGYEAIVLVGSVRVGMVLWLRLRSLLFVRA